MKKYRRMRVFCHPAIQGTLCARVAAYWVVCLAAVGGTLAVQAYLDESSLSAYEFAGYFWSQYGAVFLLPVLVLPLALLDCLIVSNRYAGPIRRIQRAMKQLAEGKQVEQLRARKNDQLHELFEDFNRIARQQDSPHEHAVERNRARECVATYRAPTEEFIEEEGCEVEAEEYHCLAESSR